MKYFSGSAASSGPTTFTVLLARNTQAFSLTSGAPENYSVVLVHVDGEIDTWSGSAPIFWLPR
jgi:hypothetical protein